MTTGSVLIVEDNVVEAIYLEKSLKSAGFEIAGIAGTADEAVSAARRCRPAVVTMDIMLPNDEAGGIKAAKTIREEFGTQIVYVTGAETSDELLAKAGETKPSSFLTKPVTEQQILASVRLAWNKATADSKVFVCYSRSDWRMFDELMMYLRPLSRIGITVWSDRQIAAGDQWKVEIVRAIERAEAAVLLVSVRFLASEYIRKEELPKLLEKWKAGRLRLLPVFIDEVPSAMLKESGLSDIEGINPPTDPVAGWKPLRRKRDAWCKVCDALCQEFDLPAGGG